MQKNVEIELKLLLGKRELKKLLASELLKGVLRAGSEKKRNLVSSYYDTADLAFKKNGVAYRVRDKGDGSFEATIKTDRKSSGGLSERVEINIPLAEDKAVIEGFGEMGLGFELTDLAPNGVEKLFTVDVVRTTYILDLDGAVAELAVDNGKIIAGKRKDDIDEIEIELVEGEVGALMNFAAKMAELVPVFTEKRSKFARGLALLGIESDLASSNIGISILWLTLYYSTACCFATVFLKKPFKVLTDHFNETHPAENAEPERSPNAVFRDAPELEEDDIY